MVPWVLVYAVNILALFAGSIVIFYSFVGGYKALGMIPLFAGVFVLCGHCIVVFFIIEQRADLDIYLTQQASDVFYLQRDLKVCKWHFFSIIVFLLL